MFGLTRREQRWKAEQAAAETYVDFLASVVKAVASVRIADAKVEEAKLLKQASEAAKQIGKN